MAALPVVCCSLLDPDPDILPGPDPVFTIVHPNGGERLYSTDVCTLRVECSGDCAGAFDSARISLSTDSGLSYIDIADSARPVAGSGGLWAWSIPDSLETPQGTVPIESYQCLIRVEAPGCEGDVSDSVFSLFRFPDGDTTHTLRLMYPNGGEMFHSGDTIILHLRVEPAYQALTVRPVIGLRLDERMSWYEFDDPEAWFLTERDTYHPFLIPDTIRIPLYNPDSAKVISTAVSTASPTCRLRVRDYDFDLSQIDDMSDEVFSVD